MFVTRFNHLWVLLAALCFTLLLSGNLASVRADDPNCPEKVCIYDTLSPAINQIVSSEITLKGSFPVAFLYVSVYNPAGQEIDKQDQRHDGSDQLTFVRNEAWTDSGNYAITVSLDPNQCVAGNCANFAMDLQVENDTKNGVARIWRRK